MAAVDDLSEQTAPRRPPLTPGQSFGEMPTVQALRYVAVSVVATPDGAQVYSFVFHLKTASGAIFTLGARYSVLRRLSYVLDAEQPVASAALPPFPSKKSLRRQTPQFLLARGKALEAYLGAALGDPRLSALPAMRELLLAAELHKPSEADVTTPSAAAAPPAMEAPVAASASGPALQALQQREPPAEALPPPREPAAAPAMAGAPRAASPDGVSRVIDTACSPPASLALALFLGSCFEQVWLCLACCLLGLAAGKLFARAARDPAMRALTHKSNGAHKPAPNGVHAAAALVPERAATSAAAPAAPPPSPPAPAGVAARTAPLAAADEPLSELDKIAGREARIALDMLAECVKCAEHRGSDRTIPGPTLRVLIIPGPTLRVLIIHGPTLRVLTIHGRRSLPGAIAGARRTLRRRHCRAGRTIRRRRTWTSS
jgi:hypothetical protein